MVQYPSGSSFSQPIGQIISMIVVIGLVIVMSVFAYPAIGPVIWANIYINGIILLVFAAGVLFCFYQVLSLVTSVNWIDKFASIDQTKEALSAPAPRLLLPLAALLRQKGARLQLGASSARSILESVANRIDETRELSRYITSTLIFLGLLGTFYGLATTVPALVETIRSLTPEEGETALDVFTRLQIGLEGQLDGMGVAFASSLLGLAGSLIVGLLELFAGHGQNRFYRQLEEWLSTITRVGFGGGDGAGEGNANEQSALGALMDHMIEQIDSMNHMYSQSVAGQSQIDARLMGLTTTLERLTQKLDTGQTEALERVAASQEQIVARMQSDQGDGIDAESRMRLRSIDVQLLRILEEMSSGRDESIAQLRADLAQLIQAIEATVKSTQNSTPSPKVR